MKERFLKLLSFIVSKHSGKVLIICGLITIILLYASTTIKVETTYTAMLPEGIPRVEEYKEILEHFGSVSSDLVVIENKEGNIDLMKKCAEDLASRISGIKAYNPEPGQKVTKAQKKILASGTLIEGIRVDTVPLVKRVDFRLDTEFLDKHSLIIQNESDLENFVAMYSDLSLQGLLKGLIDNFEKEYVEDPENISSFDGETRAIFGLKSIAEFIDGLDTFMDSGNSASAENTIRKFISGPLYFLSSDNTMLLLMVQPEDNINKNDKSLIRYGSVLWDVVQKTDLDYPELTIGATGPSILANDMIVAMNKDLGVSSIISFLCILILLIGSFGTWKNPLFTVLSLMSALIWTLGILALSIHTLNMISALFGIMLIGLGIDFGIHYITGYIGARENGLSIAESISSMYHKVGNGVLTGALSTAFVFLSLSPNEFKAMREMGIACGVGIMICYVVMSVMLPAILSWDNKGYSISGNLLRRIHLDFLPEIGNRMFNLLFTPFRSSLLNPIRKFLSFSFLSGIGRLMEKTTPAVIVLILTTISVYFSITGIKHIDFEHNIMKLEAAGIPSAVYQEKIMETFEFFPEYALITASTLDECRHIIKQLKKVADRTGLIGRIDGLTEFLPEKEVQEKNRQILERFKDSLNSKEYSISISAQELEKISEELQRLHNNIVEIGELSVASDGEGNKVATVCDEITGMVDSNSILLRLKKKITDIDECGEKLKKYQKILILTVKRLLIRKASADIVTMTNIPKDITDRYVNSVDSDRDLLITVYPREQVYDENNMNRFIQATEEVSEKVTGNLIMMNLFFSLIKEKGKVAIVIAGITVLILLLIDLKSFKHTFFASIPLVTGFCWMFGLMALFNVKFNISNFMMLPLILGIGIDDGVHMLHRYRIEGRNSLPELLRHTGRAILLTTLTTLIAFGSMTTMSRRGPASSALVLCFGVAACFVSSAFVLPALITVWEKVFPGKR